MTDKKDKQAGKEQKTNKHYTVEDLMAKFNTGYKERSKRKKK